MKPSVRVRRNSRTKLSASQVQPIRNGSARKADLKSAEEKEWQQHLEREFGKPTPGFDRGACLAIVDLNEMTPVSKIPLTEKEWASLYMMNAKENGSENFITQAIREKIAVLKEGGLMDLATKLDHNVTKLEVLADLISTHETHPDSNREGRAKERFDFGKFLLMQNLVDELTKTSDAILKKVYPQPHAAGAGN